MLRQLVASLLVVALAAVVVYWATSTGPPDCEVCHRPLHQATTYVMKTADGESVDVCCPRCGLHYQAGRDDIDDVRVADFQTGTLIAAERATFVEGSALHLCCQTPGVQEDRSGSQYQLAWDRCLPSLVAFESLQTALEFQGKNGGRLRSYDQLLQQQQAELEPAS